MYYNEYMNKSALYTLKTRAEYYVSIYIRVSKFVGLFITGYYVFDFLIVFVMLKVLLSKKSNFPHWINIMFCWHDIYTYDSIPCLTTDFSLVDYIVYVYAHRAPIYIYRNGYAMCAELWLWIERVERCLLLYKYWLKLKGNFHQNFKLWVNFVESDNLKGV